MFSLIVVLFILGLTAITLEHRLSVDKAAIALTTGALIWICIAFGGDTIDTALPAFQEYLQTHPDGTMMDFVTRYELVRHLGSIGGLVFFLLGTMTIVEIIDSYGGFSILSKVIKTTDKVKLLWTLSFLTFLLSAILNNLATTIMMIALLWKLVGGKTTRWIFASMIVIAANAGGAWSPIGNISTSMLWIGGQVSTWSIILQLFVPSLLCMLVPLVIVSLTMKGEALSPSRIDSLPLQVPMTNRERWIVLLSGIGGLLLVPVFRSVTNLPPYIGVLLALGILWIITEILHRKKQQEIKMRLTFAGILKKIDMSTIFFFVGILLAVAGLESAGHLNIAGQFLNEKVHSIYAINLLVGALSSVVNNVPLVAGTMGMYDVVSTDMLVAISDPSKAAYLKYFVSDGSFWELLAYCAGTGGNILIIGSAAGIAAMGLTKIDFKWYLKNISLLALAGYLSGIAAYYLIVG